MKKSEMVDIIYDILDRYLDGEARTSQALYVLQKIEEAGMLPPYTKVKLTEKEARLATDWLGMSEGVKRVNDWDEE